MAGLLHFRLPETTVRDGKVTVYTPDEKVPAPLNITKTPLSVTFNLFEQGRITLLDATASEEAVSDGFAIIALDKTGEIALYSKPEGTPADPLNMVSSANVALAKVRELGMLMSTKLEEDSKRREQKHPTTEASAANER
jgi:exosome complex component RRP45